MADAGGATPLQRVLLFTSLGVLLFCALLTSYRLGSRAGEVRLPPPVSPLPADAADEAYLRVHVAGAVAKPGVYTFGVRDRVIDAIDRAGGALPAARLDDLNLAAHLDDGMRLYVPDRADGPADEILVVTEDIYVRPPPAPRPAEAAAPAEPNETWLGEVADKPTAGRPETPAGPVNINTATLEQLETLPGVGPELARRILAYRETHGEFAGVESLSAVRGIGEKTVEKLRPWVTVR